VLTLAATAVVAADERVYGAIMDDRAQLRRTTLVILRRSGCTSPGKLDQFL
jgi:hypothetical protein